MRARTRIPVLLSLFLLLTSLPVHAAGPPTRIEAHEATPAEVKNPAASDDAPPPHLDIRRRSGLAPPDEASMRAWHRRYAAQAQPVKAALKRLLEARRTLPPSRLRPHCRRLGEAMEAFWTGARRNGVLPVADAAVDVHLKRLYRRIGDVAESCEAGRWAETDQALRRAGRAFREADLAMGRWDMTP